jgi:SPP1 gp7 family putative phage head morphogenesis protein
MIHSTESQRKKTRPILACDAAPQRLVSPSGRAKTLPPVRANAGIEAAYSKRLNALVEAMHRSIRRWVLAQYRRNSPEMAQDESPAAGLRNLLDRLGNAWQRRFDQAAPELADYFATAIKDRTDAALKGILKRAGLTVEFRMSRSVNDVFQATVGEQVGLIKSIAEQHLGEVQGLVMRSVTQGRDLGYLAKELEGRYGVTRNRAAFIARDQANKATATITRARQLEMGITKAKWRHSSAGNHPRASHVEADGQEYDVAKGMHIDGDWIFPGQLPNCRCTSAPIIEGFD